MSIIQSHQNLLFLGTPEDKPYLPHLKGCVGTAKCFVLTTEVQTLVEVEMYCKSRFITGIVTSSQVVLSKLLHNLSSTSLEKKPSIDNYAGSFFRKGGLEYVIVNPLSQLFTVAYGKFLTKRYISKLVNTSNWVSDLPQFNWTILSGSNMQEEFSRIESWELCAFDIETFQHPLSIRCIGFTFFTLDNTTGKYKCRSLLLPMDSEYNVVWAQRFLSTRSSKIAQNGKYDINYLLRYGIIPHNYLWDTAALMHSWYSELPKDLGSLSAFFYRESVYWKDLSETNDLNEYYKYCALDTYGTAIAFLGWMAEAPGWARENYRMEFPLQFPCILSELTGIKRDAEKLQIARTQSLEVIEQKLHKLQVSLGYPSFNPNSPVQVKNLLTVLGCKDIESTEEKDLKKAALRHPLISYFINLILDIRGDRKLISTYLRSDDDKKKSTDRSGGAKELHGRILYALNPHGTDTGRLASREHHFWCGLQIQNIPRGKAVKQTLVTDEGFLFGESDLEQAESRDTAYITGDANLIRAVESGRDFHAVNASSFFGVPYESIYSDSTKQTLDKALRDLAKRVNHGASYLMGEEVLIDTMGEDKVREAQRLLGLPKNWTLLDVAKHLLTVFTNTYPAVRIDHPAWIKQQVAMYHQLTGATGWTRYCFYDPSKSKTSLNSYVAHQAQSLNAMTLNKAYMAVFYEIALPNPTNFKLCAQIHDSILFQYRIGHEHLAHKVKQLMEIPVTCTDIKKVTRTFTVPAALKIGGKYWSDL